jgi:hypothetical protein
VQSADCCTNVDQQLEEQLKHTTVLQFASCWLANHPIVEKNGEKKKKMLAGRLAGRLCCHSRAGQGPHQFS